MRYETAALQLALDALENTASRRASEQFVIEQHAIAFIKKALDRVDHAPVAKNEEGRIKWLVDDWPQNCFLYAEPPTWTPVEIGVDVTSEGAHVVGMYVLPDAVRYVFYSQLHPSPASKPWVGLTIREIEWCFEDAGGGNIVAARNIETKLREKNAQPSKPLTDEQIMAIGKELGLKCRLGGNPNIDFDYARAIEAAHGIKENQ